MAATPSIAAPKPAVQLSVPGDASGRPAVQSTHFTRLGGVVPEEATLQQDPAATGSTALPIGSAVTAAFSPGALTYTQGTIQAVAPQAYFRLGNTAAYETWLQTDPDATLATVAPPAAPPASPPFNSHGALLHSTNAIDLFAPAINQTAKAVNTTTDFRSDFSSDTLTAVFSNNRPASITRVSADTTGVLSTCSVQAADNYSTLAGDALSTIIGSSATVWTGNDASTGIGSLLWSNCGTTQNLFGGQVVNILNNGIDVQGIGEAKLGDVATVAPESIVLAVAPTIAVQAASSTVLKYLKLINGTIAVFGAAMTDAAAMTATVDTNSATADTLRQRMFDYQQEMRTVLALVFAVQIMAIYAGLMATAAAKTVAASNTACISIGNGEITLSAGATTVTINANGFKVATGNPAAVAAEVLKQSVVALAAQLPPLAPPMGPAKVGFNTMQVSMQALAINHGVMMP